MGRPYGSKVTRQYRDLLKAKLEVLKWERWEVKRAERIRDTATAAAERAERRPYRGLPDDLVCLVCDREVLDTRQWIRLKWERAICRSCWQVKQAESVVVDGELCQETRWRFKRRVLPSEVGAQLRKLGWHPTKISKVYYGTQRLTDEDTTTIIDLWPEGAQLCQDASWWYDKGHRLQFLRRSKGLSLRVLETKLGWTHGRLRRMEAGSRISSGDLDDILENLVDISPGNTSD